MTTRVCPTHGVALFELVSTERTPLFARRRRVAGSLWRCTLCGAAGTMPPWAKDRRR